MKTLTLYDLCIKNHWLSHGTNAQYNKLFEMAANGASIEVLAAVIWVCSDTELCDVKNKLQIYAE